MIKIRRGSSSSRYDWKENYFLKGEITDHFAMDQRMKPFKDFLNVDEFRGALEFIFSRKRSAKE
jgi:hypothetical protein